MRTAASLSLRTLMRCVSTSPGITPLKSRNRSVGDPSPTSENTNVVSPPVYVTVDSPSANAGSGSSASSAAARSANILLRRFISTPPSRQPAAATLPGAIVTPHASCTARAGALCTAEAITSTT